jgi:NAD(P)-dependent dehydrogenase (short-subunit alcohol dehydrogenase family)
MVSDVNVGSGEETAKLVSKLGVRALFRRVDVSDAREVTSTVGRTFNEFGQLDFAHNNAGIEARFAPVGGWWRRRF